MASFECSKCSLATKRSYNLRRHLKDVHGIYANTFVKGDNKLQAGLPSRMSEENKMEESRIDTKLGWNKVILKKKKTNQELTL